MAVPSLAEQRMRRVEAAFSSLPERYLGMPRGFRATVTVRLGDVGRSWDVRLDGDRCRVTTPSRGAGAVTIDTDASTWLALRDGRLSGLDAFAQRRLDARGDLDLAIGFEGMFRLAGGRAPLVRVHDVETGAGRVSAITAGSGREHVVCVHGLGGTKVSFFATLAALTPEYTVHALDLPGFGSSDKPARGRYDAPWFAAAVRDFLDGIGIDRAHLVGNSMGGRVAIELALTDPGRVASLGLLAPALAFLRNRQLVPLVRLLRPEFAALPHSIAEGRVRGQFWDMFARPERLDPAVADVACDEFVRNYRARGARIAFYAAARNIYLDTPHGDRGLWTRMADLDIPSLFVWGAEDRLVPHGFSRHVERVLPSARQVTLGGCGHVPQVELPERTNRLLGEHIERNSTLAPATAEAARHRGARTRLRLDVRRRDRQRPAQRKLR